jgi:exodeoxyribonuclease VII small subunit
MAKRKTDAGDETNAPNFEDALAGLESIVEAMEHEQLPLEDLVAYYEKGSALLDRCECILQSARGRIELITLRNKNEIEADSKTGATAEMTPLSGAPEDSDDDNDDIRLF